MPLRHVYRDRATDATLELEVQEVAKHYERGAVAALDGVTFNIESGEWVGIVGSSGAGKSTLLHLFAGLDVPTSGRILVRGQDLGRYHHLAAYRRTEVGLVFQLHNLLPHLDARRNVEIAMFGTGHTPGARRARSRELLGELGLAAQAHRKPPELSGGERQRVAIARALANRPRVLLADEPTGSLDPESVAMVLGIFERLHEDGTTIVMVTHDLEVASRAERVIELRAGRVVRDERSGVLTAQSDLPA